MPTVDERVEVSTDQRARYRRMWAAALGLATTALTLWALGHQGFSHDEAFSASVARLDLSTIFQVVTNGESFHALHFWLLHVWQQSGSGFPDEAWLRLPSVVCGVAAVVTLFLLNERLFGRRAAISSCILLMTNSFFIRYAQEARSYALALFLAILATYCLVIALERHSVKAWMLYGAVSALAIYAHFFSGFVIAAHLLSFGMRPSCPRHRDVVAGYLLWALLVTPLVWLVLTTDTLSRGFIPAPGPDALIWLFLHLTGGVLQLPDGGGVASRGSHLLLLVYFLVCCTAIIFMALQAVGQRGRGRKALWSYGLILLWFAVPVVGSFVISFARPILLPRYLIVTLPSLVTIAGIGIAGLPYRALRAVALGALLSLSMVPLLSYYRNPVRAGEDWRSAVAYVLDHKKPGDGVVFLSRYGRRPFEYYRDKAGGEDGLVPIYPGVAWGGYTPVFGDSHVEQTEVAAKRLQHVRRVWIVLLWGGFENLHQDTKPVRIALEADFKEAANKRFGRIGVGLYERRR